MKDLWKRRQLLIEEQLLLEINNTDILDNTLKEAMMYSLLAGGKRLRPVMVMAAAEAVGGEGERFLSVACALEMIHTYSLIHDDLPAMDNDDYRRGKLTNHKIYGDGMAILAGDALLTLAFSVIARQNDIPAERLVMVVREIASAAGAGGMVGGQALDLESENKNIDITILEKIHNGKTGALFKAAIRSGAILAEATEQERAALDLYADKFGLAFQITDDILDVIGDSDIIGKPVGSDEKNHKSTYVSTTSLEEAQILAHKVVDEAVEALSIFDDKADFLRDLVKSLIARNK